MRKLYTDPSSTVCRPIHMFLEEHDLAVEQIVVDLKRGEHRSDWFARLNPNMAVPVFEEDGFVLTEAAAIMRYFAQLADSPTNRPSCAPAPASMRRSTGSTPASTAITATASSTRRCCRTT